MTYKQDIAIEGLKASPPAIVTGTLLAGWDLNAALVMLMIVYVIFQIGYLVWKWRRDIRRERRDDCERRAARERGSA